MTDLTGAAGATLPRLVDGPADLLLEVRGLTVQAGPAVQPLTLVEDLSLQVRGGETLGIVGETGSGKSITAMSICSLLPAGVRTEKLDVIVIGTGTAGLVAALTAAGTRRLMIAATRSTSGYSIQ